MINLFRVAEYRFRIVKVEFDDTKDGGQTELFKVQKLVKRMFRKRKWKDIGLREEGCHSSHLSLSDAEDTISRLRGVNRFEVANETSIGEY